MQLRAQSFVGHQIDRAAEQVFLIKLDAEVAFRCGRDVKCDEDSLMRNNLTRTFHKFA